MATRDNRDADQPTVGNTREWNEFAYHAFARICARKHNSVPPVTDLQSLSDGELERRVRLLSELAHLPPV